MRDAHPLPGSDVVVDGIRLHVVSYGSGTSVPLLLVHGLPTSSYLWHDVMRDLGSHRRTIAPDLVGLGASERPARGGYDLATQAERIGHLLDTLRLDRVAVAGHGLGGAVAVHLTALAPERVAALVLVDAPLHPETWPVTGALPLLAPGLAHATTAVLRRLPPLATAATGAALDAEGLEPREIARHLEPLRSGEGARGLRRLVRAVDLAPAEAAWRLVRADPPPTLVLWGDDDRLYHPSYGRRLAAELPGAVWVSVPDAGHLLPQQRPERVAEEIAGFLADAVPPARRLRQSADQ